ncbi:MAG: glutathione S-transferase family protein [Hyphomicrobiaceae bacterium]
MKLYEFSLAPNPRRVRMFLAEKGISIPTAQINTRQGEQFNEAFQKVNPRGTVPVLELEDGTCLTESVSICRYIEELHPEPRLFGSSPIERAVIDMWNRRIEIECYAPAADVVRNSLAMFEDRAIAGVPAGVPQIPALVDRGKASYERFLRRFDDQLASHEFAAGDRMSIADITAFVTLDFAKRGELEVSTAYINVRRWQEVISNRPSASV